ncbi:hypothetical protein HL653_21200 [Sphingomonas sp. AP4-R1]|uniref:glycerophosphodiester phosphodiesterase family protein n=1 Tax=Sphingomonas sp. AP4-R1 TaxID=2735134 RepID=UPI00149345D7|nr:glycerophosphodiester phosphodiesterase family protein [Sphingomonas sp. AP4-R1]QJU59927.1 hypothetical protein HL653_21200 [Sphingomonas sp. AP4-R1]
MAPMFSMGMWGAALAGALLAATPASAGGADGPLVVAHRGGAALMPENTFPAFDHAVRLGADVLEFDLGLSADDKLIVTHDSSVNGTFCTADPGSGVMPAPVHSLTLAQLQRFDCGAKHRALYPNQRAVPGTRMPTFDRLLARYKNSKALLFGEIKMPDAGEGDVDPLLFARLVEAEVRRYRLEDRFILQSADWRTIDAMHALNPRIRTCLLYVWRAKGDPLDIARQHHATCMLLRMQDADAAEVARLRAAGVMVVSEVIDDPKDWEAYRARGDDALFTNDPAGLMKALDSDRERPSLSSGMSPPRH